VFLDLDTEGKFRGVSSHQHVVATKGLYGQHAGLVLEILKSGTVWKIWPRLEDR